MEDLCLEAFMGDSSILIGFLLSKKRKTLKLPKYQMSGYLVLENVRESSLHPYKIANMLLGLENGVL